MQKIVTASSAAIALLAFTAACSGSTSDPKTISKDDLNPPFNLVSITDDSKMILQWNISNTEDDLVGFNVYVTEGKIADMKGLLKGALAGKVDLESMQVRRCDLTKDLFSKFGFNPESKFANKDCDDFSEEQEAPATSSGATDGGGVNLAEEEAETPSMVMCTDKDGNDLSKVDPEKKTRMLSVDVSKATLADGSKLTTDVKKRIGSTIRCYLKNDSDLSNIAAKEKGIANGKRYVAFVMAVAGDDANKVSYTSNFAEDTPAKYTEIKDKALPTGKYFKVAGTVANGSWEAGNPIDCPNTELCNINRQVNTSETDDSVYILNDTQTKTERIFVRGAKDRVWLLPRRPRPSYTELPGIKQPGDKPIAMSDSNPAKFETGLSLTAMPGSLFDVAVKASGGYHYGKLYVDALATDKTSGSGSNGNKTITLWMSLQPTLNEMFYGTMNPLALGGLFGAHDAP